MSARIKVKADENGKLNFHIIRPDCEGIRFCTAGTTQSPGQELIIVITDGELI